MFLDVAAAIVALCIVGGVGARLFYLAQFEKGRKFSQLEKIVFSLALGCLPVSFIILAMGLLGLYSTVAFAVLAILLALFANKCVIELASSSLACAKSSLEFARASISKPLSMQSISCIAVALLLALHFLSALAPPASPSSGPIDWDSLGYHLAVPKLYALQGGISFLDFLPNSNWPFALQMLYVPGYSLGLEGYAKLLQFGLSLALLGAILLLSRKIIGNSDASSSETTVVALAIFLSSQVVSFSFGSGAVDLAFGLYSCCAVLSLLEWRDARPTSSNKWLALCAIFAGGVAATKLNGLVALPVFFLAFAFASFVKQHGTLNKNLLTAIWHSKKQAIAFAVIALLVASPWLAKTFYYTGNPVWPFYHSSFAKLGLADNGSSEWTRSFSQGSIGGVGVPKDLENFLVLPFHLTFSGRQFNGLLSPFFLALLPLLFFVRRPKHLEFALGFGALYLLAWFHSFQEVRYLFPILPIWSVAAAHSLACLKQSFEKNSRNSSYAKFNLSVLKIIFALVLVAVIAVTFAYKVGAIPVALGLESQQSYLLRSQYNYATEEWVNANTPAHSKVLLVNDNHAYYLDRQFAYDAHWFVIKKVHLMNETEFLQFLKENGVTHVMLNSNKGFEDHPHSQQIEALVTGLLSRSQKLYEANGVSVYKLL